MKSLVGLAFPLVLIASGCRNEEPLDSPNLVVVTIDTLRADRLGLYGYFRGTTPVLDSLAKESLVFETCVAPMATTFPSHLALFTGAYPEETGAVANARVGGLAFVPTERLRSLAQFLRDGGYRTAAFVGATPLKKHTGIDAGFEHFDEPRAAQRRAEATNLRVRRWLSAQNEEPFFLWVHYFDPHAPYDAPEPFGSRFAQEPEQARYLATRQFVNASTAVHDRYDEEVAYADHQLGRLLDELKSRPELWKRTVLVVVGDHGEGLGQHGEPHHGGVWGEQLRVPLLIRVPGKTPARIERPMSTADIVPTLLGLVDLPGKEALLRQASGIDRLANDEEDPFVLSQEASNYRNGEPRGTRYALTGTEWKLVHDTVEGSRLYRVSEDPHELDDVSGRHTNVVSSLEKILLREVERQKTRRAELLSERPDVAEEVDPEVLDQLKSLGYVR
jgi:arylsulfatase A-like enzyme